MAARGRLRSLLARHAAGLSASATDAAALVRGYKRVPRLEELDQPWLLPLVTLVGRPNVGKSALFNRLVRRREALVHDTPGGHVTRDYREGLAQLADLQFRVIDTSGLEPSARPGSLQGRAAGLTRGVLGASHGVCMLLDARQGFVPGDEELLAWLRRSSSAPIVLLANKADTKAGARNLDQLTADLLGAGLDAPVPVSATTGEGWADLYQALQPLVDAGVEQLRAGGGSAGPGRPGPGPGSRHYVPAAAARLARQAEQQGAAAGGPLQQRQQQQEEAEVDEAQLATAAAAAEEREVDALLAAHSAADSAGSESDAEGSSWLSSAEPAASSGGASPEAATAAPGTGAAEQLGPLRLAILGLPNAGKSTLMNTLLGYERSLTGPEPGLTRDPTSAWLQHAGLDLQLVDTAGWKRATAPLPTQAPSSAGLAAAVAAAGRAQARVRAAQQARPLAEPGLSKQLADASLLAARRALGAVHVALLLLDAPRVLETAQACTRLELAIAGLALQQGKALVVGLNKSDAVPGGPGAAAQLRDRVAAMLEARFQHAGRLPVLLLSGLSGQGAAELLDAVAGAYTKWNARVPTRRLQQLLAKHCLRYFGSGGSGSLLARIKWATQLKARPPTFVLMLRGGEEVDEGGQRFLATVLRESLGLQGVPLRLHIRVNKRPPRAGDSSGSRGGRSSRGGSSRARGRRRQHR